MKIEMEKALNFGFDTAAVAHKAKKGDWIEIARQAYEVQQARKALQLKENEVLGLLREMSKDVSCKGGSFVFTRSERLGSIDYRLIPALKAMNLEPYRKESVETWKLQKI